MAKPTPDYHWATAVGANITTPATPTKLNGWAYEQTPPSGWQNYQMNAVGLWLDWIVAEVDAIRVPTATGRVKLVCAQGGYEQFMNWKKYADGEVNLLLEGSLQTGTSTSGGLEYHYSLVDAVTGDSVSSPWGYDVNRSIYCSASTSTLSIPTPMILNLDDDSVGTPSSKFTVLEMKEVDVSGTMYKLYTQALTTVSQSLRIDAFTAVI